nr:MAG TPA: adenine-specific methyltransferase [Caudoviricetes sp.]
MSKIYYECSDCFDFMDKMLKYKFQPNIILTSPPYNTGKKGTKESSRDNYDARYDIHLDVMTATEYRDWCVKIFHKFNDILAKDGVVLWQVSYGTNISGNQDSIGLMWNVLSDIIDKTNFTIADRIVWKKHNALPNNTSSNKLTRITEDIYVFCRKLEFQTFNANKGIASTNERTKQKFYNNIFNFIEAKNNDGACKLNKATYSSELCEKLLSIYAEEGSKVYDPFMGTGTTGIACYKMGLDCYGSELSEAQVEYSKQRLEKLKKELGDE